MARQCWEDKWGIALLHQLLWLLPVWYPGILLSSFVFSTSCYKFTFHKASSFIPLYLAAGNKQHSLLSHTPTARQQKDLLLFPFSSFTSVILLRGRSSAFPQSSNTVLTQFLLFSQIFTGSLAAAGSSHVTLLWLGTRAFCSLKEITTTIHIWKVSLPQQRTKKCVLLQERKLQK